MGNAANRAYQSIRERIVTGELAQGSHLKEEDLAAVIGVSRTPVREAIRRLSAEGLIEFVPNHGAFVTSWTIHNIRNWFAARLEMEVLCARLAATRGRQVDTDRLRRINVSMIEMVRETGIWSDTLDELNQQFHSELAINTGDQHLVGILRQVSNLPMLQRGEEAFGREELERSTMHHEEILLAIEAQDPDWAAAIMRAHLLAARHVFLGHPDLNRAFQGKAEVPKNRRRRNRPAVRDGDASGPDTAALR